VTNHLRDWIDQARFADIGHVAESLGLRLRLCYGEMIGSCPSCGGNDRFVVSLRKQIFRCRKCGAAGDAIALAAHAEGLDVNRRDDFLRAVEIVTGEPPPGAAPDPERAARLAARREKAEREHAARETDRQEHARRNQQWAIRIWQDSGPAAGTRVESYLRARGITMPPPLTLRFHSALAHLPSGGAWPAMVALVTRDRAILGIHRTFLNRDGSGKAPVEYPKMTLGPVRGGAVRLGPPADTIAVAEGIETALSVMQATGTPTWAALSTSGLKALELPDTVREVIVCADGDAEGDHAATAAARRWQLQGRRVRLARPPPGKDFNDLLVEADA
jgi:hypothetical protein